MNTSDLKSWEEHLATEVGRLRGEQERKEEELRHVRRLRELQEEEQFEGEPQSPHPQGSTPILHRQSGGRLSIAELRPAYFEWDGHRFEAVAKFLDFIGEPHYFSRIRGGKGDTDSRQIIVWAKRNQGSAQRVKVILRDGRSCPLWEIVEASLKG